MTRPRLSRPPANEKLARNPANVENSMSDPVVHFEMPYEDRDRMVRFYEKVFGWKGQKLGPEMGNPFW